MASIGFNCQVSPIDHLLALLTFSSKEEMINTIEDVRVKGWFDVVKPWCMSPTIREIAVWVILEEMPLYIWHKKFFESLGNRWGAPLFVLTIALPKGQDLILPGCLFV